MTQQLFDDMIGTPPPSTVDVDGIVRRKTGLRRLRRAAVGAAATVTVLAVVGAATLLPHGERPGPGVAERPTGSAAPSGGEDSRPDPSAFFESSMRTWLPQPLRWLDPAPRIVPPPDGGTPSSKLARVEVGGRKGTVAVTVWPRGVNAADGCDGLQRCLPLSEPGEIPACGWIRDVAVRPELGLTRPGWEVRCVKVGGRAISIMVTNQTGAPTDPLPQPELPIHLTDVLPIIAVLVDYVQ